MAGGSVGCDLGMGGSRGAGPLNYCPARAGAPDLGAGKFRGKGGSSPGSPAHQHPAATGTSWSGRSGSREVAPLPSAVPASASGVSGQGPGTGTVGGLPRRRSYPGRPSPGRAALWTQARAPGARPAQPHRPPASAPGSRGCAGAWGCRGRTAPGCAPGAQGPACPPAPRLCPGRFGSCPERCAPRSEGGWTWGLLFATLPRSPGLGFRVEGGSSWPSPRRPCPLLLPGREGGMPVCTRFQPGQALSWRPRSVPFPGERPRPRAERSPFRTSANGAWGRLLCVFPLQVEAEAGQAWTCSREIRG